MVRNGTDRLRRCRRGRRQLHVLRAARRAATACRSPIVGRPLDRHGPFHGGGQWINITPGYFDVFKIPVKRGRAFTDRDDSVAPPVVIINEALANAVLQGQGSAERAPGDRPGRDARVRHRRASGRSSASSATRATAACSRTRAGDVHPAGAGARRGQRAEPRAVADGVGGAHRRRSVRDERRDPGGAAPGHRPAGRRTCARWPTSCRARRRGSGSTCG